MEFEKTIKMKTIECCSCGTLFAMTSKMYERRVNDGKSFFCPNGHSQVFTHKENMDSKIKKVEALLDRYIKRSKQLRSIIDTKDRQINGHKGAYQRLKNKIKP